MFGALWEVEVFKKRTPLWREAHLEVKMAQKNQVRSTFGTGDVRKQHALVARRTLRSQNVQSA